MKRFLFVSILCVLFVSCTNQQQNSSNPPVQPTRVISYEEWKEEAKSNIRLLPKYGNVPKTKEQKESDKIFIDEALKQDKDLKRGSYVSLSRGFDYLYGGDLKTAMYRFNQAWLLDSTNSDVFSGFSAVYFSFNDYDAAMEQVDEGLRLNPENPNLITGKATVYYGRYRVNKKSEDLKKAFELLNISYQLDPKNDVTLYKLSALCFERGDCKNAKRYYDECMAVGGRPIDAGYAAALKEKCK